MNIKDGIKKVQWDNRDYDHLRSFGLTTFDATTLPPEFNVDAGFGVPNQNEPNPTFGIPALFWGCTGYTQTELCQDEDLKLYNPRYTYNKTYPYNEDTGRQIRDSLKVVCKEAGLKDINGDYGVPRRAYYNVEQAGKIDYFDAVRIAMWVNQAEHRSVSLAIPWYSAWQFPANGVLPIPEDFRWIPGVVPGHNAKIAGWKTIDNKLYLVCKPWQGKDFGDKGYVYFSRELFNAVLNIGGTGAFTVAPKTDGTQPVQRNVIEALVDFVRSLFNL